MRITPVLSNNVSKSNTNKDLSLNPALGKSRYSYKNSSQPSFGSVEGINEITNKYSGLKGKVKGLFKGKKRRALEKQESAEILGYARGQQELLAFYEKQKVEAEERLKTAETNKASDEELKNLKAEVEEARRATQIQEELLKVKKNKGWDKISGYFSEKEALNSGFMQAVGLEKAGNKEIGELIPNGILFFGPTGNGKTTFAKAFAEQSKCILEETMPGTSDFMDNLYKIAEKSKETFKKTNQRTIILMDEFDSIGLKAELGGNKALIGQLKAFMATCANKYKCTLFLTTNNPQDIDPILLADERTPLRVFLDPPNNENASHVFQHYLEGKSKVSKNIDTNRLADELLKPRAEGAFSNSRIRTIVENCYKQVATVADMTEDDLLQYIEKVAKPDILKEHLTKYELDKKAIFTIAKDIGKAL